VAPEQLLSLVQPMHVPAATSHTGVVPVHCALLVAEHCPQAPDG
jgi:hypothetical protein